jgi:SAM-dependent methyltransferase
VNWYDRAEAYDILCGWDPAQERDFVLAASARYGVPEPRRILEPFCGSGRLLRAMPGVAVGLDRNPFMVRYARGRGSRVFLADAGAFAVREGSFDLAYCLIDSFRHLLREEEARNHLRAVARALVPGGVYVLGFEITGDLPTGDVSREEWWLERAGTRVDGDVRCLGDGDPVSRVETMFVKLKIRHGKRRERIESIQPLRLYARADVLSLLEAVGLFDLVAVFDRRYLLDRPKPLATVTGSAVLVLRARGR